MTEFYNPEAELHLLREMVVWTEVIGEADRALSAEDFGTAWMRAVFEALVSFHEDGLGVTYDSPVVRAALIQRGSWEIVGDENLASAFKPPSGAWRRTIQVLAELGVQRRLFEAVELARMSLLGNSPPVEVLEKLTNQLTQVAVPMAAGPPEGLWTTSDFLDRPGVENPPWLVPGLFRPGWRVIVVGVEGAGKSTLLSQVAMAAAQGIHPFTFRRMTPIRTLLVDLENPDDRIVTGVRPLRDLARRAAGDNYDQGRSWVLSRPGGIDLRSRKGRSDLERTIIHARPDLVCLGPLYKTYRLVSRESYEQVAAEVTATLEDLRTRHNFALMMEHHAPKKAAGAKRELNPYGSALWDWWPEFGIKLVPPTSDTVPKDSLELGRNRFDRVKAAWPDRIDRGSTWPWVGWWENGLPSDYEEEEMF